MLIDQREFITKETNNDPVVSYQRIINNNRHFGIAIKKSGNFDIYVDMKLRDSPENVIIAEAHVTFDSFYLVY